MSSPFDASPRRSIISRMWGAVDSTRRFVFNLVFLLIVIGLLIALVMPSGDKLKDKTALVMNLKGTIVEQKSGGPRDRLMGQISGDEDGQTQLRDIIAALDAAAKDPKIDRVFLQTADFSGAGLSTLREVGSALERFKASGKQVVAWGGAYDQPSYYLAAHATELYVHPMGGVLLQGYGRTRNYYKEALDRLGISANVVRSGKFKNFGEPYFTKGPSKETLESDKFLYDGLWATYTSDIEKARKFDAGTINKYIDEVSVRLKAAGGNFGKLAVDSKLVTGAKTLDEIRAMMIERGAKDEDKKTFRQVALNDYIGKLKPQTTKSEAIGVIVAEGEIGDGTASPGRIGGISTAALVRKAREDDKIKAVVLRVNSPGGSAYSSELIRRELELTRAAGKPVVVSMGNVAASGGYWISMASDETIADAATITGSIGVFSMLPTGEKAMEKLSVYTGGYHTTWLGNAMYDPRRPLDPRIADLVKMGVDNIYTEFTTKAAAFRKTTPEKINEVAQGRVWTGAQAKELGLIDRTGSFADAIKAAATRAKLAENANVRYIEADRSKFEQFLESFSGKANVALAKYLNLKLIPSGVPATVGAEVQADLTWLAEIAERGKTGFPYAVVAHCLCVPQ
jgi:protease IV